jgi:two-component system, chemotaxis family, chemotaxis protein CheY
MTDRNRILIVDDDENILSALGELLELEGYPVEKARNGREALDRLGASRDTPGLILLDLKMPVMDGWQFLAERAKEPSARDVPVVLLSGLPYIPNAGGVADFLSKPIDPGRVLSCVRRLCREPANQKASERSSKS